MVATYYLRALGATSAEINNQYWIALNAVKPATVETPVVAAPVVEEKETNSSS